MSRHAYLIMAFSEYEQLKMLIEMLDYPGNDVYLHIDKKSPKIDSSYFEENLKYTKLYKYQEYPVYWGHYSQTACEVFLLEVAIQKDYDYIHLLSGSDLPLCGQKNIHQFFDENSGKEFVRYWGHEFPKESESWIKY